MMKLFIFSFSLPATQPPAPILSPWLPTHFTGIERVRCSFGKPQRAAGPVDNFLRIGNLSDAYFLSTADNVRKCMKTLNIPDNVLKVTHNSYFIRRALC